MTPTGCHHCGMENIAARDQAAAKEREFDRRAQKVAAYFLAFSALLGIYATLAVAGILPAMPWSPLGQ